MGQETEHQTQPLLICLPFCLLPSSLLLLLPSSSLSLLLPLHLLLPLLFLSPPLSSRSLDLRKLTPMQLTRDTLHSATGGETASTVLGINHHSLTFSFSPTSHPSHLLPSQVPVAVQSVQHMETVCGYCKTGINYLWCPSLPVHVHAHLCTFRPTHPLTLTLSPGAGLHPPLSSSCPPQTEEASAHTGYDRAA